MKEGNNIEAEVSSRTTLKLKCLVEQQKCFRSELKNKWLGVHEFIL
jgi:hypothetical protein